MTQPNVAEVEKPTDTTHTMTENHVANQEYPDPQEPSPQTAGFTIVAIIGSIAVIMIIVMVASFIYFNNYWEGPTSLVLPFVAA